eukprot:SAG11_NODE_3858_length_2188_cov_9.069890_2_plen_165_part_00
MTDGSNGDTNAEMIAVTEDLGIKFLLTSPDRMVTKMSQENMVRIFEMALKSTMIHQNSPIWQWAMIGQSVIDVKNLLQVVGRIVTSDGDAPCAMELITRERPGSTSKCSPKQCRQILKYFLPAGSAEWVSNPHILGSDLENAVRQRLCYRVGMVNDLHVHMNLE